MKTTEKIQTYLNDPTIVNVNTVSAHSDHKYFESLADAAMPYLPGKDTAMPHLSGKAAEVEELDD